MRKLAFIAFAMISLVAGCAVQETPEDPAELVETADEAEAVSALAQSCDDFDSYCNDARPCGKGYVCRLDSSNCGQNFFGTYPSCGVTATCYPACQPE